MSEQREKYTTDLGPKLGEYKARDIAGLGKDYDPNKEADIAQFIRQYEHRLIDVNMPIDFLRDLMNLVKVCKEILDDNPELEAIQKKLVKALEPIEARKAFDGILW